MTSETATKTVDIPLRLLDVEPTTVCGDRAFVLLADGVGRVEVGSPLPEDDIWNHLEGDLMLTTVQAAGDSGSSGFGGDQWSDTQLSVGWSEPGSGTGPDDKAWVVVGRIPDRFQTVLARQGHTTMRQTPVNGHAFLPLNNDGPADFEVVGVDANSEETMLFNPNEGPPAAFE